MDDKLKNMPTKQDVEDIKANMEEVKINMRELKAEKEILKSEVKCLQEQREKNHKEISHLQDHIKRNNVVFKGLTAKSSMEDTIKDCCRQNCQGNKFNIYKKAV